MKGAIIIIKQNGYEYYLREGSDRSSSGFRQPCFLGYENMALIGCKQIKK